MHRSNLVAALLPSLVRAVGVRGVLEALATGVVPHFASACAVDLASTDGTLVRVALEAERSRLLPPECRWPVSRRPHAESATLLEAPEPTPFEGWAPASVMLLVLGGRDEPRAYVWLASRARHSFDERDLAVGAQLEQAASAVLARARTVERMVRALSERGELDAMLREELRLPLDAVLGWTQLLESEPRVPSARVQRGIEAIERGGATMTKVLEDWESASRLALGTVSLTRRRVSLRAIAARAVDARRPAAEAGGVAVALEAQLGDDGAEVLGDENKLVELTTRMLDRIERLTPTGGRIRLALRRQGPSYLLSVEGTPRGRESPRPTASDAPRLGERTLTLAIVRGIAELHGGTAGAERADDLRGARIWALLPSSASDDEDEKAMPRGDELTGVRVLLVDDADDARELAATIVRSHGGRVLTAASSSEAVEQLRKVAVHVMVSDIAMPFEDGCSLVRRALELQPGLRAAALSALVEHDERERALAAGYETYLTKPIDPEQLVRAVRSLAHPIPPRAA